MNAAVEGKGGSGKADELSSHDHRSRRCPMLGHVLDFSYCRATGTGVPCRKILDCWWETFDVRSFLTAHFGEEVVAGITAPPQDRVLSLVEMIRRAREGGENGP